MNQQVTANHQVIDGTVRARLAPRPKRDSLIRDVYDAANDIGSATIDQIHGHVFKNGKTVNREKIAKALYNAHYRGWLLSTGEGPSRRFQIAPLGYFHGRRQVVRDLEKTSEKKPASEKRPRTLPTRKKAKKKRAKTKKKTTRAVRPVTPPRQPEWMPEFLRLVVGIDRRLETIETELESRKPIVPVHHIFISAMFVIGVFVGAAGVSFL